MSQNDLNLPHSAPLKKRGKIAKSISLVVVDSSTSAMPSTNPNVLIAIHDHTDVDSQDAEWTGSIETQGEDEEQQEKVEQEKEHSGPEEPRIQT